VAVGVRSCLSGSWPDAYGTNKPAKGTSLVLGVFLTSATAPPEAMLPVKAAQKAAEVFACYKVKFAILGAMAL
jgi:hypothetical protein